MEDEKHGLAPKLCHLFDNLYPLHPKQVQGALLVSLHSHTLPSSFDSTKMVPSTPPPPGWLKINVDVAVTKSHASIVVIARDHLGIPIKMWARVIKLTSPIQAEFETIFWAMLLAKYERWSHVIVEGDAKDCFDALVDPKFLPSWSIHTTIDNILALHRFFFCLD